MPIPIWLKEIVIWISVHLGQEIMMAAKDELLHQWGRFFAARNILILGARQTGKTSLLYYMRSGTPYTVQNGEIHSPDRTLVAAVVDRKFALDTQNWVKLKTDVPGDLPLRATWKQAIADVRPHGIIYMLDGRVSEDDLRGAVQEIFDHVLVHYPDGPRELSTLHIFLNFSDQWAHSPATRRRYPRLVHDVFEERLVQYHSSMSCGCRFRPLSYLRTSSAGRKCIVRW